MSEAANSSIPLEIRQQFPCDDHGRVLWFATPPLNTTTGPAKIVSPKDGNLLAHTPEYIAARERRQDLMQGKKRQFQGKGPAEEEDGRDPIDGSSGAKRRQTATDSHLDTLILQSLTDQFLNANKEWYRARHGDRAAEAEAFDAVRAEQRKKEVEAKKAYFQESRRRQEERREREKAMEGRFFRDDWDERY
jgi:chromatin structure-remodeling complex subunit RSC1/2